MTASQEFLDNSGYLKLADPPQSVDTYSRDYGGNTCVEVFRDEWNMIDVVLLTNGDGLVQEIPLTSARHMAGIGGVTVEDANFDGNDDLLLYIGGERGGQIYYAAFLWDPVSESYAYAPTFSRISAPHFDYEHHVIWGGCEFMFGYFYYAYEFVDGEFVNTHSLIGDYANWAEGTGEQCTEYARLNGAEVEVGKREFPGEAPSSAVVAYIVSGPVWEGWTWCDPRAYEMKG